MDRKSALRSIGVVFFVCVAAAATAAEIHVPADHPTIQAAIDAAHDGDAVIVSPGRYAENINFLGKAITVQSTDPGDPDVVAATIIDAAGAGRCVTFAGGEEETSVLAGFSLTNGFASHIPDHQGGAVYCKEASPVIVGNVITGNRAKGSGGAIYCDRGSPVITDNVISGNSSRGGGGAIEYGRARGAITDNVISNNSAVFGGGIRCAYASATIAGNIIEGNSGGFGGGINIVSWAPIVVNNIIAGNSANHGGGLTCDTARVLLAGNVIAGNAAGTGGGIDVSYSTLTISNTVITQNWTDFMGPAMHCSSSSVRILNSIIRHNYDSDDGQRYTPALPPPMWWPSPLSPGSTIFLAHSIAPPAILGPISVDYPDSVRAYADIDMDPPFVDPGHWDDNGTSKLSDDVFIMGDYHLLPGSPLIDVARHDVDNPDTEEIEELPDTDLAGLSRLIDGDGNGEAKLDIGPYEHLPGDANFDSTVNILDFILIRNNIGLDPASFPAARQADINADGSVDLLDFIAARNHATGQ